MPFLGTPIHYGLLYPLGLKPMWSRMPYERTPIHYGLKPMWSRMSHKGTPTFYALKRVKDRMPA